MLLPAAVLTLLLFTGCKGIHLYHADPSVIHDPGTNFYNAFIEFDDQGELLKPSQVSNAVATIKSVDPVFLVGFVHGWKNNAESNNLNFIHFTNMLAGFTQYLPDKKMKVFGVYFAWRGDPVALDDPVSWTARQLSFWSRHAAAERVAGTSATEAIYSIMQAANANTNSRVVLIGHSFGGLILEKALAQAMVSTLYSQTNVAEAKSPADLVILINPAASSIQARQFICMLGRLPTQPTNSIANAAAAATAQASAFDSNHPLIISATSKGDWATGLCFPVGMWFSGLTKTFRDYDTNDLFTGSQSYFYRTTPGHNDELLSHEIKTLYKPKHVNRSSERAAMQQNLAPPQNTTNLMDFSINGYEYEISRLTNSANNTPYWDMQVPTSIIKDHDDILNERFTGFISALLRLSQVTDLNVPKRKVKHDEFRKKK